MTITLYSALMKMPHLEEFFAHGDGSGLCAGPRASKDTKRTRQDGDDIKDSGVLFLHGPQDAGQTSLLLQFGFSQVKAGKNVVLIMRGNAGSSQQPAASEIVPISACSNCKLPIQTGENNSVWSSIHIKYLRTNAELQHFLCSLHLVDKETSVLLVDGFEGFFMGQRHLGNVYQTLAFMLEAQTFMKTTTGYGAVVVTGTTDSLLLRDRRRLRRWCRFLEIVPDVEEPDVFILREEAENAADVGEYAAGMQVVFEFTTQTEDSSGTFHLLHVQQR